MSVTVKTGITHPFDWMMAEEWSWVADMTTDSQYMPMDDLYRVIKGDITREEFVEFWGKAPKNFKKEYSEKFPDLIASCLEGLADSIRTGEIKFDIDFDD